MNIKIKNIALSGIFIGLIFLFTAYVLHIPIGVSDYIHCGDALVFLAACFLPRGYGLIAAGTGGALADLLTGYGMWAPYTFIIKATMTLAFDRKSEKIINKRNILVSFMGAIINIVLYFFAGRFVYGNWETPALALPLGSIQFALSVILFIIFGFVLDRVNFKKMFM